MSFKKFKKAFTLIELIIAIAVMGTIASFSTASYMGYKDMADKEQSKMDIQQVKNAVDNFYDANNKYPTSPIGKQPSPDITVGGKKVRMYSKIDVDKLVEERYLQAAPKLKKNEYFAVNFNGVVTIESGYSESVVIENGNIIVEAKDDNLITFDVFTGFDPTAITIFETSKDYAPSGSGFNFKASGSSAMTKGDDFEHYTGKFKVSATQGAKYFVVRVRYKDGTTKDLRANIQYALSADSVVGDVFWINKGVDQSTDAGKKTNVILPNTSVTNANSTIKINWTNSELASGASAIRYELVKEQRKSTSTSASDWKASPDSPIIVGNTEYLDKSVRSDMEYRYSIYAYTASKNNDGSDKKTLNALVSEGTKPTGYADTKSYVDNITKDDFNTAFNKDISVRAGDFDDGVMKVYLLVAKVENGVTGEFKQYEMNKTIDGTSTEKIGGKKLVTDVYTVPIEVQDDYMVYYIKVVDGRGYETFVYMNPAATKTDKETETEYELRRQVTSNGALPSDIADRCYTLMRGLIEIHNDSYIDDTKIDIPNSKYHLFDGKITLP